MAGITNWIGHGSYKVRGGVGGGGAVDSQWCLLAESSAG